jgi:hypothetical protein
MVGTEPAEVLSSRPSSPAPSAWRYWWCSTHSPQPNASRSSCMTSSTCRSTRSPRPWTAHRRPPGNSPAGPGAAFSTHPYPTPDPGQQRQVVDAFPAAARHADFGALVAVLHPDVVFRADVGPGSPRRPLPGAQPAARRVLALARGSPAPASSTAQRARYLVRARIRSPSSPSPSPAAASPRSASSPTRASCVPSLFRAEPATARQTDQPGIPRMPGSRR